MAQLRLPAFAGCLLLCGCLILAGCGSSSSSGAVATNTPARTGGHTNTAALGLLTSDSLTVGSDTTYPPMEFANPNDPSVYIGADVDLAHALANAMGLKGASIVKGAFDSLITSLQAKRYDVIMSSMNDTPARAKVVDFVDYLTASEGILVKSGSSIHADGYSALCGKTVTVQRGTTELDGLSKANTSCPAKITVLSFQDDTGAYQAFVSGHSDAYTSDLPVVANYIKTNPGKYSLAGKPISAGENYGIALRKGNPALKSALKTALSGLKANGRYIAILKKWGVEGAALK